MNKQKLEAKILEIGKIKSIVKKKELIDLGVPAAQLIPQT